VQDSEWLTSVVALDSYTALESSGETAYKHIQSAQLLCQAYDHLTNQVLAIDQLDNSIIDAQTKNSLFLHARWWLARALMLRQRVLSGPCDTLRQRILALYTDVIEFLQANTYVQVLFT
jgi:hypothetical protein